MLIPSLALVGLFSANGLAATISSLSRSANINNCSGTIPPAPDGYSAYFSRYGPQIQGDKGWETWTILVPTVGVGDVEYSATTVLQWTRGDPASSMSNPQESGTFSVTLVSYEYENVTKSFTDRLVYHQPDDSHLSISVGNNRLTFDGSLGTWGGGGWNVSVDLPGFKIELFVDPVAPHVLFTPAYGGISSQVVDGYFTNMPAPRGHIDGVVTFSSGIEVPLHAVGSLKHAYATKPIQELVSAFTRTSIFAAPYQSINWIKARGVGSQKSEAAQLVIADLDDPEGFALKYQITNDPNILEISTSGPSGLNHTVRLAGCEDTEQNAYEFTTNVQRHPITIVDSAGGKFDYYAAGVNMTLWTADNQLYSGEDGFGLLEVYTPPP